MSLAREIGGGLLDLLYPPRCGVCGEFGQQPLCARCLGDFRPVGPAVCGRCGLGVVGGDRCVDCAAGAPFAFLMARAPGQFDGPLRQAIIRLKYHGRRRLAAPLGEYLGQYLTRDPFAPHRPDVVVPVPLHRSRLRQRGFNQSALLARAAAGPLGLVVEEGLLRRTRRTQPQAQLQAHQRAANVRDAFAVPAGAALSGRTVLLVDDVLTTLATVDECARVLVDAGAKAVLVAGIARGG